jgi:hypothetical protein
LLPFGAAMKRLKYGFIAAASCVLIATDSFATRSWEIPPTRIEIEYEDIFSVEIISDSGTMEAMALNWGDKKMPVPEKLLTDIKEVDLGSVHIVISPPPIESFKFVSVEIGFGFSHCGEYGCPCTVSYVFGKDGLEWRDVERKSKSDRAVWSDEEEKELVCEVGTVDP